MELDSFGDVSVSLEVRLGERMMTLEDILNMQVDNALLFEKAAGDNLEVLAGNVAIGSGQPMVIDGRLAIRLTDFGPATLSPGTRSRQ